MDSERELPTAEEMSYWRRIFLAAALYDAVLGAAFFLFWKPIFKLLRLTPPENKSYIHLSAAFVFVQGLGYWFVNRDPRRNVDIVKVGVVYKAVYSGLAAYYLAAGQLLSSVFAWFAVFDAVFAVLFGRFLAAARRWEQQDRHHDEAA